MQLGAFPEPFKGIEYNLYTDKPREYETNYVVTNADLQKENAVGEARKSIDLSITIRKMNIWTPFAHHSGG